MRRAAVLGAAGRRRQSELAGGGGSPPAGLLVGWSMPTWPPEKTVAGVENEILGRWSAAVTWEQIAGALYLQDTELPAYVAAHPDRPLDLGVPLIPHIGIADSGWDAEMDAVIAGTHDADHYGLGQSLALLGAPLIYARLWWEFNIGGEFDRTKFKGAWQHAVPNIRAGFAAAASAGQNLKIVYNPIFDRDDWETSYPGNTVVDVVTCDIYGMIYGFDDPTVPDLIDATNGRLAILAAFGVTHNRPIGISEWANCSPKGATGFPDIRGCGDCPEYIDAMFDWAIANDALYLCFYDSNEAGVGTDLEHTPDSKARFIARAQDLQASGAPAVPTVGTATPSFSSAEVAFTPAGSGARAASYTATSTPGSFTGTSPVSPVTVSGLTAGVGYTFTVHANNAAGSSVESGVSNSATVLTPTIYVADNFNRSDGAVGVTSTGGLAWSTLGGSGSASWGVSGNELRGLDGGQHVLVVNSGHADGTVQITRVAGNTHDRLVFRCADATSYWTLDPSPYDDLFHMSKQVSGVWTDLGVGAVQSVAGAETMTVILNGNRIIGKVNGTTVFDITDSSLSTATRHGVGTDGMDWPPVFFDNFSHTSASR